MTTAPDAASLPRHAARSLELGPLRIGFDGRVLEPRPWTVAQAEWGSALLAEAPAGDVLELCTGAGQIGLLTCLGHDRALVLVDADPHACAWARINAAAAGTPGPVEVRCGDMAEVVPGTERYALVQADPPWVPSARVSDHPEDPVTAIDGGTEGLDVAVLCLQVGGRVLLPGGSLLLQLGTAEQVTALEPAAADAGLRSTETRTFTRGVVARYETA